MENTMPLHKSIVYLHPEYSPKLWLSHLKKDIIEQGWSKVSRQEWLNSLTLFILKMNDWE